MNVKFYRLTDDHSYPDRKISMMQQSGFYEGKNRVGGMIFVNKIDTVSRNICVPETCFGVSSSSLIYDWQKICT